MKRDGGKGEIPGALWRDRERVEGEVWHITNSQDNRVTGFKKTNRMKQKKSGSGQKNSSIP